MRPLPALALGAATAAAVLAALAALLGQPPTAAGGGVSVRAPMPSGPAPCPREMLPDDGVCLPLPRAPSSPEPARDDETTAIELLPERPADYGAYRLPSAVQRAEPNGVGALLHHTPGAPAQALALEGQVGAAELRRDEGTPGRSIALYTVRRADSERRYLVLLDHVRVDVGAEVRSVAPGTRLGRVVPGPLGPVLELSVRQLRQATDAALPTAQLLDDAHSIACDPRNVLERQR